MTAIDPPDTPPGGSGDGGPGSGPPPQGSTFVDPVVRPPVDDPDGHGGPRTPDPVTGPDSPPGAIPEPSTWATLLLGFGAVGYVLRRRQARFSLSH